LSSKKGGELTRANFSKKLMQVSSPEVEGFLISTNRGGVNNCSLVNAGDWQGVFPYF